MIRGWGDLIERFKLRVAQGPIDWAREVETNPNEHYSLKERSHSNPLNCVTREKKPRRVPGSLVCDNDAGRRVAERRPNAIAQSIKDSKHVNCAEISKLKILVVGDLLDPVIWGTRGSEIVIPRRRFGNVAAGEHHVGRPQFTLRYYLATCATSLP
jgi:hypothetical protein